MQQTKTKALHGFILEGLCCKNLFWRNSTPTGNFDSDLISSIALGNRGFLSTLITRGESSALELGFPRPGDWLSRWALEYEELARLYGRTVSRLLHPVNAVSKKFKVLPFRFDSPIQVSILSFHQDERFHQPAMNRSSV